MSVMIFKERAGCPGGGKGILIGYDVSFTLSTLVDETVLLPCEDEKNETVIPNDYGGIVCEQPSR